MYLLFMSLAKITFRESNQLIIYNEKKFLTFPLIILGNTSLLRTQVFLEHIALILKTGLEHIAIAS